MFILWWTIGISGDVALKTFGAAGGFIPLIGFEDCRETIGFYTSRCRFDWLVSFCLVFDGFYPITVFQAFAEKQFFLILWDYSCLNRGFKDVMVSLIQLKNAVFVVFWQSKPRLQIPCWCH